MTFVHVVEGRAPCIFPFARALFANFVACRPKIHTSQHTFTTGIYICLSVSLRAPSQEVSHLWDSKSPVHLLSGFPVKQIYADNNEHTNMTSSAQAQMPGRSPLDDIVFAARGTTKYTELDAMSTYTVAESFFSTDTRYSADTTVAYQTYSAAQNPQPVRYGQGAGVSHARHIQSDARSVRSLWVEPEPVHRYMTPDTARRPPQHATARYNDERAIEKGRARESISSMASDATVKPNGLQQEEAPAAAYTNWHYPRDLPREQYIGSNPKSRTPSPSYERPLPAFLSAPHTRRSSSAGSNSPGLKSPKGLLRALSKSGKSPQQRHVSESAATSQISLSSSSGKGSSRGHGVYDANQAEASSPRTPGGSKVDLFDSRPRSRLPRKDLIASLESLQLDETRKMHATNGLSSPPVTYTGMHGLASAPDVDAPRRPPLPSRATSRKSVKLGARQMSLNDSPMASLPDNELTPDDHVNLGIEQHEKNMLPQSTHHFRKAAEAGDPVGCLLYGLSLRHGWGCRKDVDKSLIFLEQAAKGASEAVQATMQRSAGKNLSAELAVAMFEVGMSYHNGWGVATDKKRAIEYFELASAWGDADAMVVLGDLYLRGEGCKKDKRKAAQILRAAEAKGRRDVGNSWIYKTKYDAT
jgi:TPR repeat protein